MADKEGKISPKGTEVTLFEAVDKNRVKHQIFIVRGRMVMLDSDIADYFGVTTGNLNKAKNRNIKRFPERFAFVLTDEELSLFQSGIAMQMKGVKGGRSNNPTVYTEQGIAMLTSCLHTERAISSSIQIMEAFVEMTHIMRDNQSLAQPYKLMLLENKTYQLDGRLQSIEKTMLTKADIPEFMKLFDTGIEQEEVLILDGEPFKADIAYQKIYHCAKRKIMVIDDYINPKTLQHMVHSKDSTRLTVISDNKGRRPLRMAEYQDFRSEYPGRDVTFITTSNMVHDRYIILDHNTEEMKIYHCGSSSKDAGNKITTITQLKDMSGYSDMIKKLMTNPPLVLK